MCYVTIIVMFPQNLKELFKRISLLLILYSICRLLFVLNYWDAFSDVSSGQLALSFVHGLRFDLATIFITNLLIFLPLSIPWQWLQNSKWFQKSINFYFILVNIVGVSANLADMEYFKFAGKRSTADILFLAQDIGDQGFQMIYSFWHIAILALYFWIAIFVFAKKLTPQLDNKVHVFKGIFSFVLIFLMSFAAIRGTLGSKPLRPGHAFVFKKDILGHLALTTPFVVLKNLKKKSLKKYSFYKDEEVDAILFSERNTKLSYKDHNVVLIILESFASEYFGHDDGVGYMPYLLELSKKGAFFKNNLANGRRSIESLPSILASIPAIMDLSFINSKYQDNRYSGLGDILKRSNYETSFFHGGKNGTMGFDIFSKVAGMDNYYGQFEFPNATKKDIGYWGIHDRPYLKYFAGELEKNKKPFFSAIFTLSSHQPFELPVSEQGKFKKGALEVYETLGYTDSALKDFFEIAKTKAWFKNTLFILTGDHSSLRYKKSYKHKLGDYQVPLIFYHSSVDLTSYSSDKITQHADILPSVLDFLGLSTCKRSLLGQSLFANNPGFALNYSTGVYQVFHKDYLYLYSSSKSELVNTKTMDSVDNTQIKTLLERRIKASLQFFNNKMVNNEFLGCLDL
jgi:phosphoglycerol transferase MdoB-like AlkP superfamily enzyme